MARALTLVTAPAAEPVSRTEAKNHLRVDVSDDDALIDGLIVAARRFVENVTRRALVTQTWDLSLDAFPGEGCDRIEIPLPPLQSISSVTYYNQDATPTVWSSANYLVDSAALVGRLVLGYGKSWPSFTARPINPVVVRFVAGYGGASAVPQELKHAMLLLVAEWYERREATHIGLQGASAVTPLPFAVAALLASYRVPRL